MPDDLWPRHHAPVLLLAAAEAQRSLSKIEMLANSSGHTDQSLDVF